MSFTASATPSATRRSLRLPLRLVVAGLLLAALHSQAQQPDPPQTPSPAQQTPTPAIAPPTDSTSAPPADKTATPSAPQAPTSAPVAAPPAVQTATAAATTSPQAEPPAATPPAPQAEPTPAPPSPAEQKPAPAVPLIPQQQAPQQQHFFNKPADLSFTFTQERSKFVGASTNDFFRLRGASIDYAYSLWHGLGFVIGGTGLATTNLGGSLDIHEVAFLGGARYTYNYGHITPTAWGRNGGIFIEGKVGYTFASAGLYPTGTGTTLNNTAAGLTYQGGGGLNLHVYHRFDLRLAEVDYLITQLPNGGNNQQITLRLATGINFHFGY